MVLPEDSNNMLCDLLDRIAESMEKNTTILNRIADHYDGVVPVMTRNQKRLEDSQEDNRSTLDKMYESVFVGNQR
jgi:hypothetical protein|tara:strand:- start:37 stop:261 length:225 start_codon:yes stop_codon:yes gene_type:complete